METGTKEGLFAPSSQSGVRTPLPRAGRWGTPQFRLTLAQLGAEYDMSRVQGKDLDLSSELPFSNLKDRCEACRNISACNVCGSSISGFEHVGVRATAGQESGIWHYASPCHHRNQRRATLPNVKYGGGPLWKNGYTWQSIYWAPYFTSSSALAWVASIEKAVANIESDKTYSGGLSQYNVGIGKVSSLINIKTAP